MARQWTGVVLGAWVLLSPWLLGFSDVTLAKWGNVIVGVLLVLVNAWELFGEENGDEPQRH